MTITDSTLVRVAESQYEKKLLTKNMRSLKLRESWQIMGLPIVHRKIIGEVVR